MWREFLECHGELIDSEDWACRLRKWRRAASHFPISEANVAAKFSLDQASVVITGASAGLGVEFAKQLAPRVDSILLVARRESALAEVRDELQKLNPRLKVTVCPADVSLPAGRQVIVDKIQREGLPVNLLINNAGLGDYGSFATAAPQRVQEQIDVNVTGLVQLTHSLLPLLTQHRPAGILNVSSLAGTLPLPDMAIYAATKAFVTSFSEALRIELQGKGVHVTALCPGPTPTSFSQTARRVTGEDANRSGQEFLRQPNHRVVAEGLSALEHGHATVYPGWGVALSGIMFRMMPAWLRRRLLARRWRSAQAPQ